tara:strand:- start:784 stop:2046 length:1263 start_codon:yes stop_codon:yes gene_type:complete
MQKIVINGGNFLQGKINVSGSKNASLPIMAASILTDETLELENVPDLVDVHTMSQVLSSLGVSVASQNESKNNLSLTYSDSDSVIAEYDLVRKMRASILVLGPLLARKRHASVSLPGGCAIGARPVDLHINALTKLGASFELESGYIKCNAPKGLIGNKINFDKVSVGATENIVMAASLARGESEITNIALEPEVMDLITCLNKMGAKIELGDNRNILIEGVDQLKGTVHSIIPDRIEAITYIIAGALIGKNLEITNINIEHVSNVLEILNELSINFAMKESSITVEQSSISDGITIDTMEYPGFPTDVQAQMMVLLSLGKSVSKISENIFENRFMHVPELNRMGANIEINGKTAVINPCQEFISAQVMATDLRASVSLILAGLVAKGTTTLNRIYHLDRGYEKIEEKLLACGADIQRLT